MQIKKLRQSETIPAVWEYANETVNLVIKRGIVTPRFIREIKETANKAKDEGLEQADAVHTFKINFLLKVIESWDMKDASQLPEQMQRLLNGEILFPDDDVQQKAWLQEANAQLKQTVAPLTEETFLDCNLAALTALFDFVWETSTGKKQEETDAMTESQTMTTIETLPSSLPNMVN